MTGRLCCEFHENEIIIISSTLIIGWIVLVLALLVRRIVGLALWWLIIWWLLLVRRSVLVGVRLMALRRAVRILISKLLRLQFSNIKLNSFFKLLERDFP